MANKKYYYRAAICYAHTCILGDKYLNYSDSEKRLSGLKKTYACDNSVIFIGIIKYDAKTDTPIFLP